MGTAALALPYGPPTAKRSPLEPAAARGTLLYALERGVRFIDTAPAYGEAEVLVGAALDGREDCVLATKLAVPAAGWGALSPRETRAHVRASAQASLKALRRERLDVLQIHNATAALVKRGAVVAALAELRQEELVARLGATVYGEADALAVIAAPELEVVQVAYSALDRRPERSVLPAATEGRTAVVARSLLLHGVLSPAARDLRGPFAPLRAAAEAVRRALGVSWEELPGAAVAFVASRPKVAHALIGPRDEHELAALLDEAARFAEAAAGWQPVAPTLPDGLLDPSRWPTEAPVGN
jgi:aryl-alcohol dehydrogenase-like predicted oxidoreductase